MKKQLEILRTEKKVKLSLLERSMIAIALEKLIPKIECDDEDGKGLLKAYKKLHRRMSKECKQ